MAFSRIVTLGLILTAAVTTCGGQDGTSTSDTSEDACLADDDVPWNDQVKLTDIPRLHFTGKFLADQPTLNNNVTNFNIATFRVDRDPRWNIRGSAAFRLFECAVTRVCLANGTCVDDDPIVGQAITGSDGTVAAKLVDLDPYQQMMSQLWGLVVGVNGAFQGDFVPRSFNGGRRLACSRCKSDRTYSAYYLSRLINVNWTEGQYWNKSAFLKNVMALRCKTGFQMYVKLNVRLMTVNHSSPNFPFGRVFGTIFAAITDPPVPQGPYKRMLLGDDNSKLFNAPFYVDTQRKTVVVDFANSVDTDPHGNVINITGHLYLIQCNRTQCNTCEALESARLNIGEIQYFTKSWLHQTAGVVEFSLSDTVAEDVLSTPLVVMEQINETSCEVLLQERADGVFVNSVHEPAFRKEPGETWSLTLRAFQFGKPIEGAHLELALLPLDGTGFPQDALIVSPATTDANGAARINFTSQDPGEPRADQQLDGQVYVYGVNVSLAPGQDSFQAENFMTSVHLYSDYKLLGKPTWYKDIYPIFQQYANLYPVMKPILDLASYEDVTKKVNRRMLKYALQLPMEHPNYMPVTRDLSPKKKKMILSWLDDNDNNEHRSPLGKVDISLTDLKTALQTAIQLELATIPPYLSAIFSIKEGCNEEVRALINGIVVEEMQHLALVANVLNAIGGTPVLNTQNVAPSYPSSLPGGAVPDLTVTLGRCSLDRIRNVFQKLETPECSLSTGPVTALFRHRKFNTDEDFTDKGLKELNDKCNEARSQETPQTIGAIYIHQILCPMLKLERQANKKGATIFVGNYGRQLTNKQWYGRSTDAPFAVRDITTAIKAIAYIVMEGEGSDPCNPFDQFGELSHYFKFAEIAHGRRLVRTDNSACSSDQTPTPEPTTDRPSGEEISSDECYRTTHPAMFEDHVRFRPCKEDIKCSTTFHFIGPTIPFYQDSVWPTVADPSSDMYPPHSKARKYSDIFNKVYTDLLRCLHETFNGRLDRMGDCMGMMKSLKVWADKLVRTPIHRDGDPNIGPNAAPTFQFGETNM